MKSKIFKKIALCFASALIVCSVGAFTGCAETDHPEVRITYEFNGTTYDVDYKLYRNMYPHTVKHFIELSEEGFYDNMIIHNYQSSDWFTGGYAYDEADYSAKVGNNAMKEYLEQFSKEDAYSQLFAAGKLSASVYSNRRYDEKGKEYVDGADVLPTVMGEFYNNIHQEIKKGELKADYGCLKMFYYQKNTKQKVYAMHHDNQLAFADYKNNCATSLFTLQTGSSSSYSRDEYCVFATIDDEQSLRNLVDDAKEYFEDNYGDSLSDYTVKVSAQVDVTESFSNEENDHAIEKDFTVTYMPIVIKSVKITKY